MNARTLRFFDQLARHRLVGLDTSACIYFLNGVPKRSDLVGRIVGEATGGRLQIRLSAAVKLELLVQPFRNHDRGQIERTTEFLQRTPGLIVDQISEAVIVGAAEVRARFRLNFPDALVIASAAVRGCDALVGNDHRFKAIDQIGVDARLQHGKRRLRLPEYIHLDDYVRGA